MASKIKDGSNYLDGVPVKISTKFLPPNPVTIPLALDAKLSTDLLTEHYDFSLERKVIQHHKNRLLELEAAKTKSASPEILPSDKQPIKEATKTAPWHSNTILQPSPQQPIGKATDDPLKANNDTKINLSDFENDTSSPFDYMELQTINDLEELNSVFQGISDSNVTNGAAAEASVAVEETSEDVTVAKSLSFPTTQKENPMQELVQTPWAEKIPSSLSENFTVNRISQPNNGHPISFYGSSAHSLGYSTLSQVPYIASNAGAPVGKEPSDKTTSLRGSKSYSDIHSLSDIEVMNSAKGRSRTPPSFCPVTEHAQEPETLSLDEDHFAAPLHESSNGVCHDEISAYEELNESSRLFVDSLTEMGFEQGQVARAVKHLGVDEKKVVEHLCQIQALEESGYESAEAEAALHLHDYNRDQAKEFLDLVNQFQDLGFEKDAVKKALVQNKNDWNKTIDALLP